MSFSFSWNRAIFWCVVLSNTKNACQVCCSYSRDSKEKQNNKNNKWSCYRQDRQRSIRRCQFMAKFESVILFDVIILWLLIVKLKLFKFDECWCETIVNVCGHRKKKRTDISHSCHPLLISLHVQKKREKKMQ